VKIVHLSSGISGGAGKGALRIHNALLENGIDSNLLTLQSEKDIPEMKIFSASSTRETHNSFAKTLNFVFRLLGIGTRGKLIKEFINIKDKVNCEKISLPISHYRIHKHPLISASDVIHIHWTCDMIDYLTFFKNISQPIVFTLHDTYQILGIYHYENDSIKNKQISFGLDEKVKKIKAKIFQKIQKGAVTYPSKWAMNESFQTNIFNHFKHFQINYPIPFDNFKPIDKTIVREELKVGKDSFVISFVCEHLDIYRKGFDLLQDALKLLTIDFELLIVGKGQFQNNMGRKVTFLGPIYEEEELAKIYSAADVFIVPSREELLGFVMLESFSCGTPVVGYRIGGVAEHIIENISGELADQLSSVSLSKAIMKFYYHKENYSKDVIRNYIVENFEPKKIGKQFIEVYQSILN
jgi:glycosyltransferase involved in cell wall biosynthesis